MSQQMISWRHTPSLLQGECW